MKTLTLSLLICTVLGAGFIPTGSLAQSIFLEPNSGPGIHLEALRPSLNQYNFTTFSFSYYLSARFRSSDNLGWKFEIPFASYNVQAYGDEGKGWSSIGNPYAGVEVGPATKGWQGEFGFRAPLVGDDSDAAYMGMLADPVERLEAHTRDYLPIYAGVNFKHRSENGFALMLRAVPVLEIYIGDGSGDTEVSIIHSAQAWYEVEKVGVGVGFSGRFDASGDAEGFGERSIYQFGFFANYAFGNFMPGFQVRFPLDSDLKDNIGLTPSYSLSVGLKI